MGMRKMVRFFSQLMFQSNNFKPRENHNAKNIRDFPCREENGLIWQLYSTIDSRE
jgi:hypothetical protein